MLGVMTKPVLVNNFDPIGQFKSGISSGTPWDSIVDFATSKSFCGKRLYPRQMTLLKLIYLETESMTDYDMEVINSWAEGFKNVNNPMGVQPDIWDRIEYLKANGFTHFPHVQMVMGRRASKGIIGSILATERIAWLYSLGSWQQHFNQVPGQVAEITVVANSLTQAVTRQFRDIRNAVFACEYLRPHIVGDKQTEFYIRTPGDEQTIIENNLAGITSDREIATIYCKASSSVSTSGRGGTGLFNAYDEFAHMLAGTGSTKTGEEIYDAFQPSLDQFGRHAMTYCASSPFSKIGKFYDLYQQGRITMDSYNLREGKLKTTSFIEEAQSQDIDLDPDEISAAVAEPTFLVVQLPSWDTYRDWERSREIPILPGRTRTFPRWNSPVQYEPKEDGTPDERVQYRRMRRNPDKFKVERCVDPDTRVLCADFKWRRIDDLLPGTRIVAVDEEPPHDGAKQRKMRTAVVVNKFDSFQKAYRLTFDDGSSVVCSGTHRWLSASGRAGGQRTFRWRSLFAPEGTNGPRTIMRVGDHIRYLADPWDEDFSWEAGYLAGFFDGEGTFKGRKNSAFEMSFSQLPGEVADFVLQTLKDRGFNPVQVKHCREELVGTWDEKQHRTRSAALSWRIYGFDSVLRFLGSFGSLRMVRNASGFWEGRGLPQPHKYGRVYKTITAIEELPEQRLVDIQTTTGTFVAEGLVSHNCGQFATVQDAYLNEVMVDRMFEPPDWRPPLEIQHQGKLSLSYRAHADPSRTNANFGFCIAHLEQAPPDEHGISWPHVIIDVLHVWKPEDFKDHTIDYVQVGEELDDYLRRFPSTTKMTYDQFNSAGLIAHQKRAFPNIRVLEKTFTLKENQDRCERFKSALNLGWVHCLAGETGVLTPEGVRPIRDLAGTTARLLTTSHDDGRGGGKWVDAPVQSFGVQPLMKVTLRRNGVDKVIHATANHRWFVRRSAGTASFRDGVLTANLQPGQKLSYCYSQRHKATRPSPIGIAHGFTYGDGTRSRKGAVAQFCGDKDKALIPYFDLHPIVDIAPGIRRALDLPRFFKEKVDLAESPSYLYGWLAGYMAADGHVDKEGYVTISSVDRLSIEHVRAVCNLLGVHTTTITTSASSGGYKPGSHSHVTRIDPTALTEDFFLIEEHRRRWLDTQDKQRKDYRGYTVVSVEETDRVEEVFCAVVDGTQSFTLEDNILTGNCPRDTLADEGQSLLELELKFLQEKNNRVDKQDIGPIQTKDLADAAMVVVTDLLHDSLDKWWTAINRTSVGSTDSVGLRSGRELDRISAYSAPGTGDPMQRYLAEEANRYERKTIRAERNRTVIGANKLERARRKSGQVPTYSNSRTRGFR
jgi:hypothetical protein